MNKEEVMEEIKTYPYLYFDCLIEELLKRGMTVKRLKIWVDLTEERMNIKTATVSGVIKTGKK